MHLNDTLNDIQRVNDILNISALAQDFVTSICGEFIGAGSYRAVYQYNLDPGYVVKIEPLNTNRNFVEWKLWQEIQGLCGSLAWVKDWYAPCRWLSPNGRILIMKKTVKNDKKVKPEKVPAFLWDVGERNFGWIGDKYVCHDYGENFYAGRVYSSKMKTVKW